MITTIGAMSIEQLCERKYDLLVGAEDLHKLSQDKRRYDINAFANRLKEAFNQEIPLDHTPAQPYYITLESVRKLIDDEAEQMLADMKKG